VKRGDVVLVVAQGDMGKPRPGIIVQADELGDATTSVLVCPMSSEVTEFHRLRPMVEPTARLGDGEQGNRRRQQERLRPRRPGHQRLVEARGQDRRPPRRQGRGKPASGGAVALGEKGRGDTQTQDRGEIRGAQDRAEEIAPNLLSNLRSCSSLARERDARTAR